MTSSEQIVAVKRMCAELLTCNKLATSNHWAIKEAYIMLYRVHQDIISKEDIPPKLSRCQTCKRNQCPDIGSTTALPCESYISQSKQPPSFLISEENGMKCFDQLVIASKRLKWANADWESWMPVEVKHTLVLEAEKNIREARRLITTWRIPTEYETGEKK